jgi:hypothetical protein
VISAYIGTAIGYNQDPNKLQVQELSPDEIFDLYCKTIEEEFASNHRDFNTLKKKEQSVAYIAG